MKERSILFSSNMVKAILENRKTMTRRPMKAQPWKNNVGQWLWTWKPKNNAVAFWPEISHYGPLPFLCPYGVPGDRLWVREKHAYCPCDFKDTNGIIYAADEKHNEYVASFEWRPSIHMKREFSRIILEITNGRVERLQEITEEDAEREGMDGHCSMDKMTWSTPREQFIELWESIYGKGAWNLNPWVWCISFRRLP